MGLPVLRKGSHYPHIKIKTSTAPDGPTQEQDICLKGVGPASHLMGSPSDGNRKSDFFNSDDEMEHTTSRSQHAAVPGLQLQELIGRGAFGSVYRAVWRGMQVAVKVIEHDDEELSSSADISPMSSYAALHAFPGNTAAEANMRTCSPLSAGAACIERDPVTMGCLGSPMGGGAALPAAALLSQGRLGSYKGNSRQGITSSMATTRGSAALLEAAVSSALMHPNIVQMYDYRVVDTKAHGYPFTAHCPRETHIVMEFCDGGSLEEALGRGVFHPTASCGAQKPDLAMVCATLLDIAAAMDYLHHMRVILQDLKPKNVLLASCEADARGFVVKVSDFGLSQLQPDKSPCSAPAGPAAEHASDAAGTVTHMAPEMLRGGPGSCASDVYSFGVLAWELWTRQYPYPGLSKVQIMFGVASQDMRPEVPAGMPAWFSGMVTSCWARDPRSRPSFAEVRSLLTRELAALPAAT